MGAETRVMLTEDAIEKFWSQVEKASTCWLWQGGRTDQGYGVASFSGVRPYAHRMAWLLTHGPISDGLQLDHICRVRHCVNPDHLEPVTHRENGLRGISPQAINARKTHCVRGHKFTPENTYNPPKGGRRCRTCMREHDARRTPRRRKAKA